MASGDGRPSTDGAALDSAQQAGYGDMPPDEFRRWAHAAVERMADYLADVERYAVLPPVEPGELRARFPSAPPEAPESFAGILEDFGREVEPNVTHWQHPGFFAYFASSGSGAGIIGEMLMATLIGNAMLWRTSPISTELEEVTVGWFRQALGLPEGFDGFYTDTASTSSLIGLAGARQTVAGADAAADGLASRPPMRIYASQEAHSSIEKAAMTLGLGRVGLRRVAVDENYAMRPEALEAAIREDRDAGIVPAGIVSTIGTTSSTAIDPTAALSDIAERQQLWLHVDAAYAGVTALLQECRGSFAGWERADSIVINPHKWLFTPIDCSLFLTRRPDAVRSAFSLVPEYLRTLDQERPVHDFNEYTPQLGRRFRALKMWFILRYFGLEGLRSRIREHMAMAQELTRWVDDEPDAERLAPVPFSTVCFRWRPQSHASGDGRHSPQSADDDEAALDALNERILEQVNRTGEVFLSHTRLSGRFTLRIAIGHIRTERRHVERAWQLVCEAGRALSGSARAATRRETPADDDLDAREEARIRRRDRDAEADDRAPMRPGMGKVFKQIQDAQVEAAKQAQRPDASQPSKAGRQHRPP